MSTLRSRCTLSLAIALAVPAAACLDTQAPPGDPENFDPISTYPAVQSYAGEGFVLTQMAAVGVRKDGTIDLTDKSFNPEVEYRFQREVAPPDDAPPVGAGGGGKWLMEVTVTVERPGKTWHETSNNYEGRRRTKGMMREEGTPRSGEPEQGLARPSCSFAQMWEHAIEQGAPAEAVAEIDYDERGYEWSIQGTDFEFEFDPSCALIAD